MPPKKSDKKKEWFTHQLMAWNQTNDRTLPWKGVRDPYRIWLSEIILQQTRVAQGLPYYERFVTAFPTVHDLANATEDEVMKLWEGLGYYSRARNLHTTAKYISNTLAGTFPGSYNGLLALKGVGPYTAAAIASFAFGEPAAVVDGNVYRVLARFFGIDTDNQSTQGKKQFTKLANELIDSKTPGDYNQAIMDFGASVCIPASPDCLVCPLSEMCMAYEKGRVEELPVKKKPIPKKERHFHYLQVVSDQDTWIRKRPAGDIWQGLYEFPLVEGDGLLSVDELTAHPQFKKSIGTVKNITPFQDVHRHILTHQRIIARFFLMEGEPAKEGGFIKVPRDKLSTFAFPRLIASHLKNKTLSLSLD